MHKIFGAHSASARSNVLLLRTEIDEPCVQCAYRVHMMTRHRFAARTKYTVDCKIFLSGSK